jgi:para-aminobenzoate synthetase
VSRTLLIDNYDSYTYNLFQLLAQVNGVVPEVVRNDERALSEMDPNDFDNVVISPGPGHPGRVRDFGLSADVLLDWDLPALGVCLGHQGMGLLAGAEVGPAPEPRHGHLTAVRHDGEELMAGLPQGFTGVRYHSLCVREPVPADIRVTAWAEDGVIMGLRHLRRPWWGVQFHPESVATEYGRRLVENFRRLTSERRRRREASGPPHRAAVRPDRAVAPIAGGDHRTLRVRWTCIDRAVDPEAIFEEHYAGGEHAFWLDSSRVEPGLSRFSFVGDAGGPLGEVLTYRVGSGQVHVRAAGGSADAEPGSIFDVLARRLAGRSADAGDLPFDFHGGYVGFFGYELKADCGSPNRHRADTPDAVWLFVDRLVCVDHQDRRTYLVALCTADGGGQATAEAWLAELGGRLRRLPDWAPAEAPPAGGREAPPDLEPWLVRDRDGYVADIEECQRQLRAGESYEICLTTSIRVPLEVPPLEFYRRQRRSNPAPYAAFLQLGDVAIASSSPERFLKIDRDRRVESKPIKGTGPRGSTPAIDEKLRRELAESQKARAENLMIVDLLRNDLGRVCEVGTVRVPKLMAVESYTTVHQLVSTIEGRLAGGVSAVDCVRACFPGGSMTGAPKLRTMEIIDRLETGARGVYSGAIGFLGCNGTADLSIVIRTAVLHGGALTCGAGGAIVLDSDPAEEFDEMLLKAAAPLRAWPALDRLTCAALEEG